MIIEQKQQFRPITITLETEAEVDALWRICQSGRGDDTMREAICEWFDQCARLEVDK